MKWEYYAYRFVDIVNFNTLEDRMKVFKDLGIGGWELVSVDNAIAYFKRPLNKSPLGIVVVYTDDSKNAQDLADEINKRLKIYD